MTSWRRRDSQPLPVLDNRGGRQPLPASAPDPRVEARIVPVPRSSRVSGRTLSILSLATGFRLPPVPHGAGADAELTGLLSDRLARVTKWSSPPPTELAVVRSPL